MIHPHSKCSDSEQEYYSYIEQISSVYYYLPQPLFKAAVFAVFNFFQVRSLSTSTINNENVYSPLPTFKFSGDDDLRSTEKSFSEDVDMEANTTHQQQPQPQVKNYDPDVCCYNYLY